MSVTVTVNDSLSHLSGVTQAVTQYRTQSQSQSSPWLTSERLRVWG